MLRGIGFSGLLLRTPQLALQRLVEHIRQAVGILWPDHDVDLALTSELYRLFLRLQRALEMYMLGFLRFCLNSRGL